MSDSIIPSDYQVKSFWKRPEGKVGMFVIAAALAAFVLTGGYAAVATLIMTALEDTITIAILGFVVVCLYFVLTSKRFWTLIGGLFKSAMRAATGAFIAIDPIGIMRNYVDELRDRLTHIGDTINQLRGQMSQVKIAIERNKSDYNKAVSMAKAAKDHGMQSQVILNARKAGRKQNSNISLEQLYTKLDALMRMLNKMKDVSQFMYEDISDQVDNMERQKKSVDLAFSAMRMAMSFINDNSDDKKIYDQATQYVLDDCANKLGQIDDFMDVAKPFIDGMDLQNMSFEEDTLKNLEAWEQNADKMLVGDTKSLIGPQLSSLLDSTVEQVPVNAAATTPTPKKYLKTN